MRTFKSWVQLSHHIPTVTENPMLMVDFQALGRIDIHLMEIKASEKTLNDNPLTPEEQLLTIEEALQQEMYIHLSRLWVLSAYEIARILKESEPEYFTEIYQLIRKVRIPMAKYEKAGNKRMRTVAAIGTSLIDGELGWVIDEGVFITRNQIATQLIEAAQEYHSKSE